MSVKRRELMLWCGYALWGISMLVPSGLGSGIRGLGIWTLPMMLSFGFSNLTAGTLAGAFGGLVLLMGVACNVLIFLRLPRWLAWTALVLPLLPFVLLVHNMGSWAFGFYCFYPWIAGIWLILFSKLKAGSPLTIRE